MQETFLGDIAKGPTICTTILGRFIPDICHCRYATALLRGCKNYTKKCVNARKLDKRAQILRFLCRKVHWLEKISTPPPVVAVVTMTNISYEQVFIFRHTDSWQLKYYFYWKSFSGGNMCYFFVSNVLTPCSGRNPSELRKSTMKIILRKGGP